MLRAVSEIAFGATLYYVSTEITGNETFMKQARRPINRAILTLCRVICYVVPLMYAHKFVLGHKFSEGFDLHALFFLGIGILLTFSDLGWTIPDCKLTRYLGKISVPIYIFHKMLRATWMDFLGVSKVSQEYAWIMLSVCVVASIVLMYLTDFVEGRVIKIRAARRDKLPE
jgi:peptidoglycan/LPS O-acetylase OafA/YrhL